MNISSSNLNPLLYASYVQLQTRFPIYNASFTNKNKISPCKLLRNGRFSLENPSIYVTQDNTHHRFLSPIHRFRDTADFSATEMAASALKRVFTTHPIDFICLIANCRYWTGCLVDDDSVSLFWFSDKPSKRTQTHEQSQNKINHHH